MRSRPTLAITVFLTFFASSAARPAEPASRPAGPQPAARTRQLEALVARCDEVLARSPDVPAALQRRAEALCLLGRVEASVRDFDRAVAADPASAPENWQRGIALYYAGRFADGAAQFEQHRTVNPQDVENAAWHYLCLARALGPEKGPAAARAGLIPIRSDPRVPLMKVHELYAGTATAADVVAAARAGEPTAAELRERLFYAHLYIALFHEANGRTDQARAHVRLAAGEHGVDGYMGDVARLHAWVLDRREAAGPATRAAN